MKVALTAAATVKLKSAPAGLQAHTSQVIEQLRASKGPSGEPIQGVDGAFQAGVSGSQLLVLYTVSGDVATVVGVLTPEQRALGNSTEKQTTESSRPERGAGV